MFVDGEFVEATGAVRDIIDPATANVIAQVADATPDDVARATAAARRAFDREGWPRTPPRDRARILHTLAAKLRERAGELSALETLNSGKPIAEAEEDIEEAAACFEYYAGLATKLAGEALPVPANALMLTLKEPIGVAAQIIPWNFPLLMAAWKLAPALCAGCTVVLKPAPQTPLTVLAFASSFAEAGVPAGVVNIVTGGAATGAALVDRPEVDKVAFTGSPEAGRDVMRRAAATLKKISLELGGKSPAIFFADADFPSAIEAAIFGIFTNQGEICSAGSRILVDRRIYRDFLDAMVARVRQIRLGPPADPTTHMGPLVSADHLARVMDYVAIGRREAKLAIGGARPDAPPLDRGFFVEPTVFYDVPGSARIAREEIFGPVAAVMPFADEAEAIRLANDTHYGLAAAVWTRDIFRALNVVRELRAGIVWVNDSQTSVVEAPWGGYKQSGVGRELGLHGVDEYLEIKQVYLNLDDQKFSPPS